MSGDNFAVHILSSGKENLDTIAKLIIRNRCSSAEYYVSDHLNGIVLFWHKPGGKLKFSIPRLEKPHELCTDRRDDSRDTIDSHVMRLPFLLNQSNVTDFLWCVLQDFTYPQEPDHDGDNEKGFIITTGNEWGQIKDEDYCILQMAPAWIMLGK